MAQRSITSFFTKQAAPKPAASSPLKTVGTKALSTKQESPSTKASSVSPSPASSPAKAESPEKKPLIVKTYARKKKARVVEEDDEEDIELDFEPKKASPVKKRPVSDSESNDSPIKRCKRVRRAIESSDEEDCNESKEKPDINDDVAEAKENLSNNLSEKKKASPKAKAKSTPKDKPAAKRGRKPNKAKAEEKEEESDEDGAEKNQTPLNKKSKKKSSPKKSEKDESEHAGKGGKGKATSQKKESPKKEPIDSDEEVKKEKSNTPPSAAKKSQGSLAAFFKPKGKDSAESTASSDESGNKFSEALKRAQYHPVDNAMWSRDKPTPYQAFARTLEAIEGTSGRLKTIEILANYFRSVMVLTPSDLLPSVYMCLNRLAPEYEGIELGIGDMLLMKAIAQTTGRSLQQVRTDANKIGDLGEVAETSRGSQKTMFTPAPLTVQAVFAKLKEVSALTGQASTNNKVAKIQGLLVACRGVEARYLVRSLAGKLRIGLAEQSVLQALAHACVMTPPTGLSDSSSEKDLCAYRTSASDGFKEALEKEALALKTAYCECPNYDRVIPVLLCDGPFGLSAKCKLTPGIPLKPMLAHPTKGVQEVLSRFDKLAFTCEWKYDGERAQIHLSEDGKVSIYSRNQENNTSKYPDVVSRFKACVGEDVTTCVIDAEAVAWSKEKAQILPFQILSTRKRKDAAETDIKVQVVVFAFDLLYLNGEALVRKSFRERRELLKKHFKEVEGEFTFAKSADPETLEQVQEVLEESVKDSCEGLMVKTLDVDATYEIAKRSRNWLKLKKDYLDGVGDTLDVVVMGGYLGRGKRTGSYGGFLLGCYDADNEEYQTLCKIGTGFSDEDLAKHYNYFKDKIIEKPKSYYSFDSSLVPDHWFEPSQVWEIKAADLSVSPVHKAAVGLVDPERGVSLRFPRFIRVRDDKQPEDATTAQQVADMYQSQEQIKATTSNAGSKDDDFDF